MKGGSLAEGASATVCVLFIPAEGGLLVKGYLWRLFCGVNTRYSLYRIHSIHLKFVSNNNLIKPIVYIFKILRGCQKSRCHEFQKCYDVHLNFQSNMNFRQNMLRFLKLFWLIGVCKYIYKVCFQKCRIWPQWITKNCNWCHNVVTSHRDGCLSHDVVTSHGDRCLQTWKTTSQTPVISD